MKRNKDTKGRGEISETVDHSNSDMDEKLGDLDKVQQDVATVRDTLASLEFGGTSEGADAVEQSITDAENITVDVFDQQDGELDDMQSGSQEFQSELEDHSASDQSDLERVSEASGRLETDETVSELVKAKEAALRDIDFLMEQIERAQTARDESERTQEDYKQSVHSGGQ
ncbi:hypothetical protein PDESU_02035 [Pontiella desulfatans]|uniref:Chromosome partition protein Smc n=1 Tax=Pontiella desulfatans TaxID=2750659 RepID=A0A6C2U0J1_PONDE|nr:hypothetical protein [Pontiella desulfatans]VGO13478.1 hypothetical protein PDESU_02035 [Pontiella desulfatans]